MWDAGQYLRYGDERARPFIDLIARIGAAAPSSVVDLGCGPGNLTALLAQRWPGADVSGVDNSPEMIEAARAAAPALDFETGDVRDWRPARAPDVITCNAVLQWVPDHDDLLLSWADMLAPGGWLAFQLPGNAGGSLPGGERGVTGGSLPGGERGVTGGSLPGGDTAPTHALVAELAASPRWRALLAGVELNRQAGDPTDYVRLLARPGFQVDAWETTYQHILPGKEPVLEWTKGTTLRPVLAVLDEEQAADFIAEYAVGLRRAYAAESFGTLFPFRRVFAVVHRRELVS
jgi:trans-aconitate 2-methyltransferase